MAFKLVYLSQNDAQWKGDRLGFGDAGDTIEKFGCALTSVAMLLSGHGLEETPATLNKKLQNKQGFISSLIRWDVVCQVHSQVRLRQIVDCRESDAPLAQIDASLAAGQPVVVLVDNDRDPDLDWHYVLLYAREGDDYLMLDPWPYTPGIDKKDYLTKRYGYGRALKRTIRQVLFYEVSGSGGPISTPGSTTTAPTQPTTAPSTGSGVYARVMDSVAWGLNVRSSTDTSSMANVVVSVPAGTQLMLLDASDAAKIGQSNQWLRVRAPGGQEGFAAGWFLEKVAAVTPAPVTEPAPIPVSEAPTPSTPTTPAPTPSTPSTPAPQPTPPSAPVETTKEKLFVVVTQAVGSNGLRLRNSPSMGGALVKMLKAGTKLTVVEPARKAKEKVGKTHQWIYVREPDGKKGYVAAEYVKLV
ncbi:MAG TPA: SH3 domain-containing protein [Anaerolineales bacterium]|nr:SH3 domain-containing protein [Anaerolineales bacterium]